MKNMNRRFLNVLFFSFVWGSLSVACADSPTSLSQPTSTPLSLIESSSQKTTIVRGTSTQPIPTAEMAKKWNGQPLAPPSLLRVVDQPNDNGDALIVSWKGLPDGHSGKALKKYKLFVAHHPEGPWFFVSESEKNPPSQLRQEKVFVGYKRSLKLSESQSENKTFKRTKNNTQFISAHPGETYYFKVAAFASNYPLSYSSIVGPFRPIRQWFHRGKTFILLLGLLLCFFIIYFIQSAKKGKHLFIRKLAGLEAVEEAVGRATEMGRPVLFIPGILDMDNVQTLAGLTILNYLSKTIAEYDTTVDVPVCRSLVMTTAREVVYQGYLEAGRPDAYSDEIVHYITDEQFGYVAAVNGTIVRDKPATCFYMGAFFAESLILAETGNNIGAIQIAGTAMPSQLPFFVAACDYTLIGEELFAASAYLSNDPKQMGSLKGQDVGKAIAMITILFGSLLATLVVCTGNADLEAILKRFVSLFS